MATKRTTNSDDSASDFGSSLILTKDQDNVNHSNVGKRVQKSKDVPKNFQTVRGSKPRKKPVKITPTSSYGSRSSSGSINVSKPRSAALNSTQAENFHRRIENEYETLQRSEAAYCFYIENSYIRAREELQRSDDGTYFIRQAEERERISNIAYFLDFVCHKEVVEVPICCDKDRRTFWFLSGFGHGSEIQKLYTGIDIMIKHKRENNFFELQYPFQICLYKPIDRKFDFCLPLPDEVRAKGGQTTILHELATQDLPQFFNEIIRISKDNGHPLQDKSQFIVNKINARNQHGQTPLILAIQSRKYQFVELLLDNKANVNMTDSQGCSPLHYACQQANSKILKKLIDREADPHYFNRRETADGTCQSNLSAFHYLAMAKNATKKYIKRCAMYLLECGCPLMPLTREGKSPFDIAQMYDNNAYDCVKTFCNKHEFNNLIPVDVSSRDGAKMFLGDLACPDMFGKFRSRLKQYDNRDCLGVNGLFLLYRIRRTKSQPNEELGLCVHYDGQVFVYPITQKHRATITDPSDSSRQILYKYCLITGTSKDDQSQMIVFRCCEELVYSYIKNRGILPTTLKDFVQKGTNGIVTMKASMLLLPNSEQTNSTDSEDSEVEDVLAPVNFDVTLIDHFDLSKISSLELLNENRRRLIWLAKVRLNQQISFSIVIKDYLPDNDIDAFQEYRLNEFNGLSQHQSHGSRDEFSYEFSSRTRLEYDHESRLLLNELKNHPFIVHTFICNHNLKRGLRIFMEYLPSGNLYTYLTQSNSNSSDLLSNAFHWIYQLAQVMAYLSNKKIVHRDLATRNILFQNEQHIKLSDFGLSRFAGEILEGSNWTVPPRWTAPECFDRSQKISSSSDVWSFGIVIWEIYSFGAQPYETETITNNHSQQLVRLLKRFLIEQNRRLSRPDYCSESMYDLMCRCWNGNIEKRPRFVDIIDDFNGRSIIKDRIIPFSRDEKNAWKNAKEKYLTISTPVSTPSTGDGEYVEVEDNETDDTTLF